MGHRREAWSAEQREPRYHSFRFNRRNIPAKEHEQLRTGPDDWRLGYDVNGPAAAAMGVRGPEDGRSLRSLPGPTVIYTRELQDLQRQADSRYRDVYLEDIEGTDYPAAGQMMDHRQVRGRIPAREVRINAEEDHDTDSIRRHEVERGSDLGRGGEVRRNDGNRDIDNEGREYRFALHRENNQGVTRARVDEETGHLSTVVASRREQFYIRDGNAEILRLVTRGQSGEEQEFAQVAPQPQQRPMTLVPPRQQDHTVRADNGKEILMQRFMEDQRNNSSSQQVEAPDSDLLTSLHQQDMLVRRLLEEEARLNNTLLLTEALVAQRQHEQFLATAGENVETQSLPGQTTMATQTDVDSSTQTEPMHLMRPPRRRARSDNDDSYTEEEEREGESNERDTEGLNPPGTAVHGFWIKKHRSKRKRGFFHKGDLKMKRIGWKGGLTLPGKRHKIKTPIMEETESALEGSERQQDHVAFGNYSENKTSMLRRRSNKAKVATSSGDMEVTSVTTRRQGGLEDAEEETPTDSLEEQSPSKKHHESYVTIDNYRSTRTPKISSASMADERNVNFDDSRWPSSKMHRVEFQDIETRGNVSVSHTRGESQSDKGRIRASGFEESSDTSGNPSEQESSAESRRREKHAMPGFVDQNETNDMRRGRSEAGLDVSGSSRKFRRDSIPNEEKTNRKTKLSSRRGSLSEPGRDEEEDLSRRQTVASRAKSLTHLNNEGKKNEDTTGPVNGPAPRKGSRYMEWYKTKREERERRKREEEEKKMKKKDAERKKQKPDRTGTTDKKLAKNLENQKRGILVEDRGARRIGGEDVDKVLEKAGEQILKVTVFDDDMDSGIAMSSLLMGGGGKKKRNQQMMEKKSVFTIAYDDMQTKQLRPDSSSPQY